jgi:hypothetical protein
MLKSGGLPPPPAAPPCDSYQPRDHESSQHKRDPLPTPPQDRSRIAAAPQSMLYGEIFVAESDTESARGRDPEVMRTESVGRVGGIASLSPGGPWWKAPDAMRSANICILIVWV